MIKRKLTFVLVCWMGFGCGIFGPGEDVHFEWRSEVVKSPREFARIVSTGGDAPGLIDGGIVVGSGCTNLRLEHERQAGRIELTVVRVFEQEKDVACLSTVMQGLYTITVDDPARGDSVLLMHDDVEALRAMF